MVIQQFDIYSTTLDPTLGSEIKKTRPCVIVSPNEMNALNTVIIAPLTSKGFKAPSRISLQFQGKQGLIVLDQIRAIDKKRLHKRMGQLSTSSSQKVCSTLQEMFAY